MSGGPWIPDWLERLVPRRHREEWLGDLIERWHEGRSRGRSAARETTLLWARLLRSVVEAPLMERRYGAGDPRAAVERTSSFAGLGRDLRLAARMLRREPAASGAVLGTLALGVWAFLTGFAFIDGVLLAPLGYPEEERLVIVGQGEAGLFGISMPDHVELVEENDVFDRAGVWQGWNVLMRPDDGPWSSVPAASASSSYFTMLGAEVALGRLFGPADDAPGHEPMVVLSHATWIDRFGGAADVLERRIEHDGVSYAVVGVLTDGFRDPLPALFGWSQPQLWRVTPSNFHEWRTDRGQVSFWTLARLRPGIDLASASVTVRARSAEILGVRPDEVDIRVRAYDDLHGRRARGSLLLLLGAGVGVLLVSAANVVNLLLARGTGRVDELSVRAALGASRLRLVRQLVVEAALLGVLAAAAGALLTRYTLDPLASLSAALLPTDVTIQVDLRVVVTALAVAVLASVLAALPPAVRATRSSHLAGLRQGARGAARRSTLQSGLVIGQTALAVVLVTASGLLVRSLWALGREDLGFDAETVAVTYVALHPELFGDVADQSATLGRLEERLAALPGVLGAASITDAPMSGRVNSTRIARTDVEESSELRHLQTLVRAVTPDYFTVMGIESVAGRGLEDADRPGAPEVAVVNRTYARRHFPDDDPIGRTVVVRGVTRSIVGVVEDVTEFSVGSPRSPVLYVTYAQEVQPWMRAGVYLLLRTGGSTPSLEALRSAAADIDARLPVGAPFRLSDYVDSDTAGHRFRALLAVSLGMLALALASVGLAGVTAYLVGRRTRELGVRVALGADPRRIAGLVLKGSGTLTAIGVGLGIVASIPAGRLLAGFLFGVSPFDPPTLALAALVLAASSLIAAAVPTRRALRIAPVDALRQE